jgi:hypothetical protein
MKLALVDNISIFFAQPARKMALADDAVEP